jgi:NADPH:quinone reductase-like Zn-dependent oxidoreductase
MPHAVQYNEFGSIDVLEFATVDELAPAAGQVAVAVKAAGLNPFDFKLRSGVIPMPVEFPRVVGSDFAGVVTNVGEGANYADGSSVAVGDEVLGWIDSGSWREQAVVEATNLAHKPANLSWELAGGLSTAALTAQACIDLMGPKTGDTVVVGAAAGAVGIVFCQLAVAAGARVIGTASQRNHEFLRSIGVEPVTYGEGLAQRLRSLTPNGTTFVQDNWGREFIDIALEIGVPADKICTIVDHKATADLGLANPGRYARSAATLEKIARKVASGDIVLPIERTFALREFREAFELLEARHLRGKIILVP